MSRFTNKVALITGGGTGIGRAVAKALVAEGARVVVTGRREEPLAQLAAEFPDAVRYITMDVTEKGAPTNAVRFVIEPSWLIGNSESLAYVKDQMGHHSIQITVDTYGHLIPGANRQAVNRLAAMLENAPPARPEQKRGQAESPNPLKRLVGHAGIEPATS